MWHVTTEWMDAEAVMDSLYGELGPINFTTYCWNICLFCNSIWQYAHQWALYAHTIQKLIFLIEGKS